MKIHQLIIPDDGSLLILHTIHLHQTLPPAPPLSKVPGAFDEFFIMNFDLSFPKISSREKMKFTVPLLLAADLSSAGKGGRKGKHGGVDLDATRFQYTTPKCLLAPEFCNNNMNEIIRTESGSITLNRAQYKPMTSKLFQIKLPGTDY